MPIRSHITYTDQWDQVHVVGEVQNDGSRNLRGVKVVARFYDADDRLIATADAYAHIDILRPSEKAPFELLVRDLGPAGTAAPEDGATPDEDAAVRGAAFARYEVEATGTETADEPFLGIQFVQHAAEQDADGNLTLIGEVTNIADPPASQVRVSASLYDAENNVLDVGFTYAEANIVERGDIAPFKLHVTGAHGVPELYHIITYGRQATEYELGRRAQLEVLTTHAGRDARDALALIGEVRNTGPDDAALVQVYASFYDPDDNLVAVGSDYAWRDRLAPGERAPFEIVLLRAPPETDHWSIWAQGGTVVEDEGGIAARQGALTLENIENWVDDEERITFRGTVVNAGQERATDVEVGATIYGPGEQVIGVQRVFLEGDLDPGASQAFELAVRADGEAQTFALYAQSKIVE